MLENLIFTQDSFPFTVHPWFFSNNLICLALSVFIYFFSHPQAHAQGPISVLPALHNVTNFMLRTITAGSPSELATHRNGDQDIHFAFTRSWTLQCNKYLLGKQTRWNICVFLHWMVNAWLNNEQRMKDVPLLRKSSILKLNAIKQSLKIGEIEKPKLQFRRVCKYFMFTKVLLFETFFSLNESDKHQENQELDLFFVITITKTFSFVRYFQWSSWLDTN